MKTYETSEIRNIGLLAHGGVGKTSLGEAMLFAAKVTTRLGKVDDETSLLDFEPEEQKRRLTTKVALASVEHAGRKVNIIDTPGVADFFADSREALPAMDCAVLLASATDGVEVGTSRCWRLIAKGGQPAAIVVSKLDRAPERFHSVLEDLRKSLEAPAVAVQLPLVRGGQLVGLVDLLTLRAWEFGADDWSVGTPVDVPNDVARQVGDARVALMEAVAETDEVLLEHYFEDGELRQPELVAGFNAAFHRGALVPVFCVAALRGFGVAQFLEAVAEVFPSPTHRAPVVAEGAGGEPVELVADPTAPFAGYVFKTLVDPYAGTISLMRVLSGEIGGDGVLNDTTSGETERFNGLYTVLGKKTTPVGRAVAGDIVALTKLKAVRTRHTLASPDRPVIVRGIPPKETVISFDVVPKTASDEGKVSQALQRLAIEDVSMTVGRDEQSKHFLVSGMGQLHIETSVEKLQRKFGVAVTLEPPRVPYRETIRASVQGIQGRHRKQTGGAGQFGDIWVDVEPAPRGTGFEFVDNIVGGSVPRNFIPAVEKGFQESMARGYLAGFPVVDLRVRLYDGSYHPVDSSEMAFKAAAWLAFKAAMAKAQPCLLEPIMHIDVGVPDDCLGDVMGDLSSRRGRVQGMDSQGRLQVIRALVPMAEVLRYANDLRSLTGGRGEFHLEFSHYDILPDHLSGKVIDEHKRDLEEHP